MLIASVTTTNRKPKRVAHLESGTTRREQRSLDGKCTEESDLFFREQERSELAPTAGSVSIGVIVKQPVGQTVTRRCLKDDNIKISSELRFSALLLNWAIQLAMAAFTTASAYSR
jgi:hypothetical protein